MSNKEPIYQAANIIRRSKRVIVFTGAGVSVESGIPPFRGPNGIWSKYDPHTLDISHFRAQPEIAWETINKIFYENFRTAQPNDAHRVLVEMETRGVIHGIITQNIDNLHQTAGSMNVIEYHGNSQRLVCQTCARTSTVTNEILSDIPPRCTNCSTILKPDFVFFGEPIPIKAQQFALQETISADTWLVIGTTGEVFPAASLPIEAKYRGQKIIEINIEPSNYTYQITDVYLEGPASVIVRKLWDSIRQNDS